MTSIRHLTRSIVAASLFAALAGPASAQSELATDDLAAAQAEIEAAEIMVRFGQTEAPAKAEGTLRLATYNIENLFDDVDDPNLSGRDEDIDNLKPFHERVAVAMAIRELDADILCLQEVESREALMWFHDEFLSEMGYEHIVSIDAGSSRGIENAVFSRYPITHHQNWPNKPLGGVHPEKYGNSENWYAGEPIAFRRSPLMVDVRIPSGNDASQTLTLFVVHHKSGRHAQYWREAESTGVLEQINAVLKDDPDRAVAILGDFNASVSDQSVRTYLDNGFHDIFADHRPGNAITTHESGRRIDLILANQAAISQMLTEQAFVLGTAARPEGVSWRDLDTFPGLASDHYPVAVDLRAK